MLTPSGILKLRSINPKKLFQEVRLPVLAHLRPSSRRGWIWPLVQDLGILCFSTKPSLDPSSQAGKGLSLRDCELWGFGLGDVCRSFQQNPQPQPCGRSHWQD